MGLPTSSSRPVQAAHRSRTAGGRKIEAWLHAQQARIVPPTRCGGVRGTIVVGSGGGAAGMADQVAGGRAAHLGVSCPEGGPLPGPLHGAPLACAPTSTPFRLPVSLICSPFPPPPLESPLVSFPVPLHYGRQGSRSPCRRASWPSTRAPWRPSTTTWRSRRRWSRTCRRRSTPRAALPAFRPT